MKTRNKLFALSMLGVFMATFVAGGMAYAATDLGGTAAYAVDGHIAVGRAELDRLNRRSHGTSRSRRRCR